MAVVYHIVIDLFCLTTGGLSKKPGQVCDSRVNYTIYHLTTRAWRTHIRAEAAMELYAETIRRQCPVYMSQLFLMRILLNSRVSHCCILSVSHCLFSQKLLPSLSYYCVSDFSSMVAGPGLALAYRHHFFCFFCEPVATDSDNLDLFTFMLKICE